jgi:hypothetical protein
VITVKRISTGSQVKIVPKTPDLIDGKTSVPLTAQFKFVQLVAGAGNAWHIIASN